MLTDCNRPWRSIWRGESVNHVVARERDNYLARFSAAGDWSSQKCAKMEEAVTERQEDDCPYYSLFTEIINLPAAPGCPQDHKHMRPGENAMSDLLVALGIETARAWVTLKDRLVFGLPFDFFSGGHVL